METKCFCYFCVSLYQCLQECVAACSAPCTVAHVSGSLSRSLSLSLPVSNKNHVEQTERWIEVYCV